MTERLENLERVIRGELPAPPIAQLIGFKLVAVQRGEAVVDFESSAKHTNPMGTLHGGIVCDLADAAMGTAMATTLEDDESFTTLDITAKYFKPIWKARLRATARLVKRTRSLGLIECDVEDDAGSLVAKVFSSCMVLRGQEAQGR